MDKNMSAYIIVGFTPKNEEALQRYGAKVPATLALYSGEVLVKGPAEPLHGTFDYKMQLVISFPGRDDAMAWYHSDEYQSLVETRNRGMDAQFQLIG